MSAQIPREWNVVPDPRLALTHALPHVVVSQVLRPEIAAFIPPKRVVLKCRIDAKHCVSKLVLMHKPGPPPQAPAPTASAPSAPTSCAPSAPTSTTSANTSSLLDFASELPHLTALDFAFTAVNADDLSGLRLLRSIRTLNLGSCPHVDAAAFAHISTLKTLQSLNVARCNKVNSAGLRHITSLPALTTLDAEGCAGIDRVAVACIASVPNLQSLDLQRCDGIETEALGELAAKAQSLRTLSLSGCFSVADDGLRHVARIQSLEVLDISRCSGISAAGIAFLAALPKLRKINVANCRGVDRVLAEEALRNVERMDSRILPRSA